MALVRQDILKEAIEEYEKLVAITGLGYLHQDDCDSASGNC